MATSAPLSPVYKTASKDLYRIAKTKVKRTDEEKLKAAEKGLAAKKIKMPYQYISPNEKNAKFDKCLKKLHERCFA